MWLPHADASGPRSFTFGRNVVLKRLKRVKNKRELAVKGLHFPFSTSWSVPLNVFVAFVFVQRVFLPGGTILVSSCTAQPGDAVF